MLFVSFFLAIFTNTGNINKVKKSIIILSVFSFFGFVASMYFTFLQAFIIHSWCQYCLLSAFTSTSLFGISLILLKKIYYEKRERPF